MSVFFRSLPRRFMSINRPSPPPLPPAQQREFENLVRKANTTPLASTQLHPDAPTPVKPQFEGDTNPLTGEKGGPKSEPVNRWAEHSAGDWSFKGRVSDF